MPFPTVIKENNLSVAWLKIFNAVLEARGHEITPLVVSVGGFPDNHTIPEDPVIRAKLDAFLDEHEEQGCHTVANTIFPIRMYEMAKYDRQRLFADYKLIYPRIVAAKKRLNNRGLYFERMIMGNGGGEADNQLDYIINRYNDRGNSGIRRSALQVSIFRPVDDHKSTPYLGFPCLQHLSVVPNKTTQTLSLNAFYAQQDVVRKAYGNYLGLCRLATFFSREMSLKLDTVTCYIGTEKIEADVTIMELRELAAKLVSPAAAND